MIAKGTIASPDVAPGKTGNLKLDLPTDWKNADALAVTARNPNGQELWTWVYPLQPGKPLCAGRVAGCIDHGAHLIF